MMNHTAAAVVETYRLFLNGRYIRKATRVTINGQRVSFIELMPKRLAVPQAIELLKRGHMEKGVR